MRTGSPAQLGNRSQPTRRSTAEHNAANAFASTASSAQLVAAGLRRAQRSDVLRDEPVAAIRPLGEVVMGACVGVPPAGGVERPSLHFEPGEGAHLLGRQLVLGLGIEA